MVDLNAFLYYLSLNPSLLDEQKHGKLSGLRRVLVAVVDNHETTYGTCIFCEHTAADGCHDAYSTWEDGNETETECPVETARHLLEAMTNTVCSMCKIRPFRYLKGEYAFCTECYSLVKGLYTKLQIEGVLRIYEQELQKVKEAAEEGGIGVDK